MTVRLSDPVMTPRGEVATISELLERGEVTLSTANHFNGGKGSDRVAYFADHVDGGSWEIGRLAYESRTGKKSERPSLNSPDHPMNGWPSGWKW